jgi:hypothetical protein
VPPENSFSCVESFNDNLNLNQTCLTAPMKIGYLPLIALTLTACATTDNAPQSTQPETFVSPSRTTQVTQAVTSPLSDLNLVKADIPPVLLSAQAAPYALPVNPTCPLLALDVQALDSVLGPDLDTPANAQNPGLIERGGREASNAAVGAIRGAAEGVVPFRGWVRKLSGAERYSREVAAAIAAGTVRRAFLKGVGQNMGCQSPAAPNVAPSTAPNK